MPGFRFLKTGKVVEVAAYSLRDLPGFGFLNLPMLLKLPVFFARIARFHFLKSGNVVEVAGYSLRDLPGFRFLKSGNLVEVAGYSLCDLPGFGFLKSSNVVQVAGYSWQTEALDTSDRKSIARKSEPISRADRKVCLAWRHRSAEPTSKRDGEQISSANPAQTLRRLELKHLRDNPSH